MSRPERLPAAPAPARWTRLRAAARWLRPPTEQWAFWVVQVGVAAVALVHEVYLDDMHRVLPFEYPSSFTVSLMLVPVVYAALNFGVRGAVATAMWATALMLPDLIGQHFHNRPQAWIETSTLLMVNAVAVIVGQRVDRERYARQRAERALTESERSQQRYRTLFEGQHAPILIVSQLGEILEANAAAEALFGDPVGAQLPDLLPAPLPDVDGDARGAVKIEDPSGEPRWFLPSVRALPTLTYGLSVQIVLTDITAEIRRQEEHQAYSGHLIAVQEEERRRLARELHDDPLQTLTFLVRSLDGLATDPGLPARLAEELQRDGVLAGQTSSALREIIRGLRPPVLDDLGLEPAVRHIASDVADRCGIPVSVSVSGKPGRLDPDVELTLYRVAQEALSNTVRHSGADSASVALDFSDVVTLTVVDNGVGVPEEPRRANPRGGLGIVGMRERLAQVSGTLEIRADPGAGTRVRAVVPCRLPDREPQPLRATSD